MSLAPLHPRSTILSRRIPIIYQGHQIPARARSLSKLLPGLRHEIASDGAIYLDDYIQESHLYQRGPEGQRAVRQAWKIVVEGQLRNENDAMYIGFTSFVQDRLEASWRDDFGRSLSTTSSPRPRTKLLFEALAEMSGRYRSPVLGNVLAAFWQKFGDRVAREDPYVDEWAVAIMRAHMGKAQKILSFQQIVRMRPDMGGSDWFEGEESFAHDVKRFIRRLRHVAGVMQRHGEFGMEPSRVRPNIHRAISHPGPYTPSLVDGYGLGPGPMVMYEEYDSDPEYGFIHRRGSPNQLSRTKALEQVVKKHDIELENNRRRTEEREFEVDALMARIESMGEQIELLSGL